MPFDFYVHGLWIIGAIALMFGAMIVGNLAWIEGTTTFSYAVSAVIAVLLVLFAGVCWISAGVNARDEFR